MELEELDASYETVPVKTEIVTKKLCSSKEPAILLNRLDSRQAVNGTKRLDCNFTQVRILGFDGKDGDD